MHLGNQAITWECASLGLGLASLGGWAVSRFSNRGEVIPNTKQNALTAAAWGAFIFAAQMVNLPVGSHSSAHLVGGVLITHVLGVQTALPLMALVLLSQGIFLGDGGLIALGMNFCNMALVPAIVTMFVERVSGKNWLSLAISSLIAIVLAAMLIPLEVAVGRTAEELATWREFSAQVIGLHVFAALLEAMFTVGLAMLWQWLYVTLPYQNQTRIGLAMLAAGTVFFADSLSSTLPDGYEAAAAGHWESLLAVNNLSWHVATSLGETGTGMLALASVLFIGYCATFMRDSVHVSMRTSS